MFDVFDNPQAQADDFVVAIVIYLIVAIGFVVVLLGSRNSYERTYRLLGFYLTYNLFELTAKRLTHFTWYVYPIKTTLLIVLLLSWLSGRRHRPTPDAQAPLRKILTLYLAVAGLQIFNPLLGNPLVGLMGWHNDFVFALFYFMAFDVMADWSRVRRFLALTAVLGVTSAIGCYIEQILGPDVLLHAYPTFVQLLHWDEMGRVFVRPISLSVYMEVFGIAAMLTLLALAESQATRVALIVGIFGCGIANVLHGVRIAWLAIVLFVAIFTLLNWRRSILHTIVFAMCAIVSVQVALQLSEGAIAVRLESLETPLETFTETRLGGLTALPDVVATYPFGLGPGRTSPGLRFLEHGSTYAALGTHNYLTDLAGQLSIIGLLLFLVFSLAILWRGFFGFYRLRDEKRAMIAACGFAVVGSTVVSLFAGAGLGAYPVSEYFWLMAGMLMRAVSRSPDQEIVIPEEIRQSTRSARRVVHGG